MQDKVTTAIGQNCSALFTNKDGHRDAFLSSNERCKAPCISKGLLSMPPSLKQSKRRDLFFVMPIDSLMVDSTFEQSTFLSDEVRAAAVGLQ